ncbi:ABC transporter permease [Aequorivita capsosiphonis]|uniref:ABC transporter permease n=1 Tax=Aequorivita capsosiphonis TaxID=487317 RepID=UPI00047D1E2A|nr:ABC transporter permease [Aequorivita capsosiphonis]
MIRNYFKIAWRSLFADKKYAFMNIAGLAVGMAAAVLIALWIVDELSFDRSYSTTDRLYQVYSKDSFDGKSNIWGRTPGPLVSALKSDFPEVEDAVRFAEDTELLSVGDKRLNTKGAITDSGFLKVFGVASISGNAATALTNPSGIVITQSLSKKIFGNTDALGKTIRINNKFDREITAIIPDFPSNSRFHKTEFLLPFEYWLQAWGSGMTESWTANNFITYVLLKPNMDLEMLNNKIQNTIRSHTSSSSDPVQTQIMLHPASKWRLYSKSENGQLIGGEITNVWRMGRIAIFILLIACINFMNLSTARSGKRAKEVGIRKVVGGSRKSLVFQFLGESVLLSFISGAIAFALAFIFLPSFNLLVGKSLYFSYDNPSFWLIAFSFILLTGLLAGSYPAFFLSSFKPIKVLKSGFKLSKNAFNPRKLLVVSQFAIAILLIICTVIIKQQTLFAKERDLGFDENNLLYVTLNDELKGNYEIIKKELIAKNLATSVTKTLSPISKIQSDRWGFSWEGSSESDKKQDFIYLSSDADFIKTSGVKLVDGRDIDIYNYKSDSTALLLNEKAVKVMGLKNPIGAIIRDDDKQMHVVGVVKDFIMGSPYEPVQPLMIEGPSAWFGYVNMRLNPLNATADNLKQIEAIFKEHNPLFPFEYSFTDQQYELKFKGEQTMGALASIFSGLTIFIACLGLFALAAYTTETRRKEIGIRKVLGAPVLLIATLLSKDFLKLVGIAFVIAAPIAYFVMNNWLENYQYRISIEWWVFAVVGLSAILIALITVSFQAIKAAIANPVKSLRTE